MTTLTATAIITAVDRASAVFARVGANAAAQAGKFTAAAAAVSRFGSAAAMSIGAPASLAGALAFKGEYEVDKLARLMQSAGELTEAQRDALKASAFEASLATGLRAQEIITAQSELIKGGLDAATAESTATMFAKIARANGVSSEKVAEDAINVSNALGYAMGTTEEKIASLTKAMEFMSVVPNVSTESWEGLRTSMKYAAPVAGALKIPVEELGAALSILADAGFKGEEAGTALRTIMVRALAPTAKARAELRAAGVDLEDLFSFDKGKVGDMGALEERIKANGLGTGQDLSKVLSRFAADPSKFGGVYRMGDAMNEALAKALGIGKGDAENRKILKASIDNHFRAASGGFDLERYFKGIMSLEPAAMKEMFGLQRISQAMKLKDEINKIMNLPDGQRISKFQKLRREIEKLSPGSIERRFGVVGQGFAFQIDRMGAALSALRNSVFESGVGSDLTGFITGLATSVERLRSTDPGALKAITYAVAGLAAVGPAAWVLGGVATGLAGIATALASPAIAGVVAAGGIAALLGVDLLEPFMSKSFDPFGGQTSSFLGGGAPIWQTIEAGKAAFGEIAGLVGDIGKGVASIYGQLKEVFGLSGEGSVLMDSLWVLNKVLKGIAHAVSMIRQSAPAIGDYIGKLTRGEAAKPEVDSVGGTLGLPIDPTSGPPQNDNAFNRLIGAMNQRATDPVQVQGNAQVQVENKVRIEIDGPGRVVEQSGGSARASVPLDTGRGMPDTGSPMP